MSKRICIIFGHYNTKDSFCSAVRDTFISESKEIGNEIDLINLYDEKELIRIPKPLQKYLNKEVIKVK